MFPDFRVEHAGNRIDADTALAPILGFQLDADARRRSAGIEQEAALPGGTSIALRDRAC